MRLLLNIQPDSCLGMLHSFLLKNLQERDHIDSTREVSPLTQAADAIVLDNSHMTIEDQMAWVKNIISERFGC